MRRNCRTPSFASAGRGERAGRAPAPLCRAGPDETPADRIPVQAALWRGPCKHLPEDVAGARRRRRGSRRDRRQRAGHRPLDRTGGARPVRAEADLRHPDEPCWSPARARRCHRESVSRDGSTPRQGDRRPDSRGRRGAHARHVRRVAPRTPDAALGQGTARRQAVRRHLRVGRARRPERGRAPRRGRSVAQAATRSGIALSPARGARLEDLRDRQAALRRPEGLPGHHGGGEVRRAVRPDCRASRHRAALWPCVRYRPVRRRLDRERGKDIRRGYVQHPGLQGCAGRAVAFGVLLLRGGGARRQRATGIPAGGRGRSMKWLIINGDDFGASRGINRGIIQAHHDGILTSASLLVNRPASIEAAALARQHAGLSLGLHLELDAGDLDEGGVAAQCERQLAQFRELTGERPTHVDSHHDVHRDPHVLPHVLALAQRVGAPVRGHSGARHLGKFYGRWGGATRPEQTRGEGQLRPARDPERQSYVISTFLERMQQLGFEGRTLLYTLDGDPRFIGCTWGEAEAVLRRADVLLNFHYAIDPRLLAGARRTALVDIDPGLLQFWMSSGQLKVPPHDSYLTTGETVGTPAARFSDCSLRWTHIRPPVCLDLWPVTYDARSEAFTTVSSWSSASWLKVDRNGETVLLDNTKRVSFLDFVDLPRHTSQPLELALYLLDRDPEGERRLKQAEQDAADRAHLESYGWRVRDSREVAGSPEAYRAYVQQSRGEFSCAKPSCMEFQNAWVSDRTLCYLASGKPVVVQHTGPSSYLPHGEGMFRFTSLREAVEALESIASDYTRHCRAARDIAETHFDAQRVLETALNAALSTQPAALQRAGT